MKYVALLALNKVVESHPYLVALHEDVILACIDDADISIRLRALELVVGMVNAQNMSSIVDRLIQQLHNAPTTSAADEPVNDRGASVGLYATADSDDSDAEQPVRAREKKSSGIPPIPDDYRKSIIRNILQMCSRNTYANINDFDWYIDVLVRLVRCVPAQSGNATDSPSTMPATGSDGIDEDDLAAAIGAELRNVAVRVKSSRQEAIRAAETLVSLTRRSDVFPITGTGAQSVLEPASWLVGEFPKLLGDAEGTMTSLLDSINNQLPAQVLAVYVQAAVKLLAFLLGDVRQIWTPERKTVATLLMARVIHFLEPLTVHPSLEVQERAVEYLELVRLANEAAAVHPMETGEGSDAEPPLLLTQAIPALFTGMDLNPVAAGAQRKVPIPDELDLDAPINDNLYALLNVPDFDATADADDEFYQHYNQRQAPQSVSQPAIARLESAHAEISYQNGDTTALVDPEGSMRRKAERRERHKDDPFYIADNSSNDQVHNILKSNNGQDLDVDAIPIMELNLENTELDMKHSAASKAKSTKKKKPRNFEILADETIGDGDSENSVQSRSASQARTKKSLLQVDSSGLKSLSLDSGSARSTQLDVERREAEEAEMAKAMKEVERLRLEMQRAKERIEEPSADVVAKKKKKKTTKTESTAGIEVDAEGAVVVKKPKKKVKEKADSAAADDVAAEPAKPKKKTKRRQIAFDEDGG